MSDTTFTQRFSLIWHSLVSRGLFWFTLMALLAFTAFYRVTLLERMQNARHNLTNEMTYLSTFAVQSLGLPMWNMDAAQVTSQLQPLQTHTSFCGVRVHDMKGDSMVNMQFPASLHHKQHIMARDVMFTDPADPLAGPQKIGEMQLCIDTRPTEVAAAARTQKHSIMVGVLLVVLLFLNYIVLRLVVTPLNQIKHVMRRAHEFVKIEDPTLLKPNEVGSLALTFNRMITELQHAQETMKWAKEQAEMADRSKSNFLSNMTHELRTPLNSVIGMANLMLDKPLDADTREMLKVIIQSSTMLLEIVNDILDISKIESGVVKLEAIGFDLEATVNAVVDSHRLAAKQKNLRLTCEFNSKPPYLLGDPLRVSQVVNNFVSNAIRYTDYGAVTVRVITSMLPDYRMGVHIRVTDTGIGIPEDKQKMVFEKFTQADASNTRRYGGTGLGLAITRELVEQMGGKIGVESAPGAGATFWCKIPFEVSEKLHRDILHQPELRQVGAFGAIPAEHARVLVVEDHPLNQEVVKRLLPKFGIQHYTLVDNGRQAIDAALTGSYDLVLMDCFLPEINGYDATRTIRRHEDKTIAGIPIIAMTANAMVGEREKCLAAGMNDYIPKPILEDDFMSVLSQWISFPFCPMPVQEQQMLINPVIDLNILNTFACNNRETLQELISIFLVQAESEVERLRECLLQRDDVQWVEVAHRLKGSAAGAGAMRLRSLAHEAQLMRHDLAGERQEILTKIANEFQAVCAELRSAGYEA